VERYFRDIAQVTDVVAMEVAVSNALAWDLVGCTPFDFLSQLCGLVPAEATKGLFGFQDAATLGRVLLKDSVCLARLAASGACAWWGGFAPGSGGHFFFWLLAKLLATLGLLASARACVATPLPPRRARPLLCNEGHWWEGACEGRMGVWLVGCVWFPAPTRNAGTHRPSPSSFLFPP
jgi:hypothetical protein